MSRFSFILIATSFISLTAFAESQGEKGKDVTSTSLRFEDFRQACLNPAQFHNQVAPKNIQVSCKDAQEKWVVEKDGRTQMETHRAVATTVTSDKYNSITVSGTVPSSEQSVTCPQLKQVLETVELIQATSCEQMVAFTGSALDFCVEAINQLKASNPNAVTTTPTGMVMNFCAGVAQKSEAGAQ